MIRHILIIAVLSLILSECSAFTVVDCNITTNASSDGESSPSCTLTAVNQTISFPLILDVQALWTWLYIEYSFTFTNLRTVPCDDDGVGTTQDIFSIYPASTYSWYNDSAGDVDINATVRYDDGAEFRRTMGNIKTGLYRDWGECSAPLSVLHPNDTHLIVSKKCKISSHLAMIVLYGGDDNSNITAPVLTSYTITFTKYDNDARSMKFQIIMVVYIMLPMLLIMLVIRFRTYFHLVTWPFVRRCHLVLDAPYAHHDVGKMVTNPFIPGVRDMRMKLFGFDQLFSPIVIGVSLQASLLLIFVSMTYMFITTGMLQAPTSLSLTLTAQAGSAVMLMFSIYPYLTFHRWSVASMEFLHLLERGIVLEHDRTFWFQNDIMIASCFVVMMFVIVLNDLPTLAWWVWPVVIVLCAMYLYVAYSTSKRLTLPLERASKVLGNYNLAVLPERFVRAYVEHKATQLKTMLKKTYGRDIKVMLVEREFDKDSGLAQRLLDKGFEFSLEDYYSWFSGLKPDQKLGLGLRPLSIFKFRLTNFGFGMLYYWTPWLITEHIKLVASSSSSSSSNNTKTDNTTKPSVTLNASPNNDNTEPLIAP